MTTEPAREGVPARLRAHHHLGHHLFLTARRRGGTQRTPRGDRPATGWPVSDRRIFVQVASGPTWFRLHSVHALNSFLALPTSATSYGRQDWAIMHDEPHGWTPRPCAHRMPAFTSQGDATAALPPASSTPLGYRTARVIACDTEELWRVEKPSPPPTAAHRPRGCRPRYTRAS
ncbi:hypothetical protein ACIP5N_21215 [Streptomyces sp. NPDC088768]|uniref:hypothetical protein n=1 Tax=Streptomyces sp. NPDC088768 TaxID=3365894 RepID=UPI00382AA3D9